MNRLTMLTGCDQENPRISWDFSRKTGGLKRNHPRIPGIFQDVLWDLSGSSQQSVRISCSVTHTNSGFDTSTTTPR